MTDLQATNRTKLSKVRESTYGVIPTNPAFQQQRTTGGSLNSNPQTVITQEIRPDRQVTDLILVGLAANGTINGEMSFETFDDHMEEALQGTWSNTPYIQNLTADTEISDASTTTLTVSTGGTAFKTGHLTLTSGFGTSANNKLARVSSSTGTTIVYPAATFTAEASIPDEADVRVVGFQGASGDLVATATGGNAITSTALDFTTLGLAEGMYIYIGDGTSGNSFATAANNGWARIAADGIAATRLDLDVVPAGFIADAGTGKTLRVFIGDILKNASTKRSSTFERQFLDHSPVTYEYFRGMEVNTMSLNLQQRSIATVSFGYIGKDAFNDDARPSGVSDIDQTTTDVINTSTDIGNISFDGTIISGPNFVMSMTIDVNNNLRQQEAIGTIGAVGIGNGEFTVTGNINTYFGSPEIYNKVLDNTRTSFAATIGGTDAENQAYVVDLPSLKFSAGAPTITGKNQDVMLQGTYQAIMHPDLGYTMSVGRFWYLPV